MQIVQKPRKLLCYLLEYADDSGYLGNRFVESLPEGIDAGEMNDVIVAEDMEIKASFSRNRMLRKGQVVRVFVQRMEGREL